MNVMRIFLHRALVATTSLFIFLPVCAALAAPSQAPTPINDLNGTWVNVDPHASEFSRLVIEGTTIHPYAACQPRPCDWGEVEARIYGASVRSPIPIAMTATVDNHFDQVVITLLLEADGRLRIDSFTHFTDGSRRADYHSSGYLVRADVRSDH